MSPLVRRSCPLVLWADAQVQEQKADAFIRSEPLISLRRLLLQGQKADAFNRFEFKTFFISGYLPAVENQGKRADALNRFELKEINSALYAPLPELWVGRILFRCNVESRVYSPSAG